MTNENEQGVHGESMHEKLCAYVLGELEGAERMEIERELLRSPDLRAQRDTIERTIGLVKETMGRGDTLSAEAAESVFSAAIPSKPTAWKSSGFLRLAAGIGAVALGFAIVRESRSVPATEVARLDLDEKKRFAERGFTSERRKEAEPVLADKIAQAPSAKGVSGATKPDSRLTGLGYEGVDAPRKPKAEISSVLTGVGATAGELNTQSIGSDQFSSTDELLRRQRELDAAITAGTYTKESVDLEQNIYHLGTEDLKRGVGGASQAPLTKDLQSHQWVTSAGPSGPAGPSTAGSTLHYGRGAAPAPTPASPPVTDASAGLRLAGTGEAAPSLEVPSRKSKSRAGGKSDPATLGAEPRGSEMPKAEEELVAFEEVADMGLDSRDEETKSDRAAGGFLARDDDAGSIPYYKLSPADQQVYLERECRRILTGCVRRPNEKPRDMFFRFWGDNPFEVTALDAQSTFAADVDTASYTLARRYINEGNVPTKAQIRTEEFVNYFKSDVAAPASGVFAIHTDLTPSRYSSDTTRQMLRVVVRGKDLSKTERPRMNLTFVVDVSGSMREQMRLEMVKTAIRLLVTQLTPYDRIGIVKFSTDASVVLPLTNVSEREKIELAISPLQPEGSTNSNAGLELGYGMAVGAFDPEATNRVVFLSDGVANVGETDPAKIAERVKPMREKGLYLNTIGVGMNNHNDVLLEQLADKADGMCAYIDTADEAKKQLVDNFSGAFQPIARDVKIQVEFDASQVLRYRLLGYENRAIADADFRNDKVDAGELGAGHQVTALYEIERQGAASAEKPLATVHVRWKDPSHFGLNPESDKASEISHAVAGQMSTFEGAGQSFRKAVMAAQFAEILRRSVHARGDSLDALLNDAVKLQAEIPSDLEFTEFVTLVSKSKDLILRTMPACDELCQAIDEVRESQYRRAQIESMQRELDQRTLADLKMQNDVLEAKLRELVRRRLENQPR